MTQGSVTGQYTGNFYTEDGDSRRPEEWETEETPLSYWYVRDTSGEEYGSPEGIILSGEIGSTGLLEVVLTEEVLNDMLAKLASLKGSFKE